MTVSVVAVVQLADLQTDHHMFCNCAAVWAWTSAQIISNKRNWNDSFFHWIIQKTGTEIAELCKGISYYFSLRYSTVTTSRIYPSNRSLSFNSNVVPPWWLITDNLINPNSRMLTGPRSSHGLCWKLFYRWALFLYHDLFYFMKCEYGEFRSKFKIFRFLGTCNIFMCLINRFWYSTFKLKVFYSKKIFLRTVLEAKLNERTKMVRFDWFMEI